MKVVVFGYHNVGTRCLETLLKLGAEIPLVVTHQDDPGEEIWFDSVAAAAARHGLNVETPENPNRPEFVQKIRAIRPDAIFSFYYRKLLSEELLACAEKGAFNLHGSLLPKYRGRCPVNWALIHGEKETGATLHEMVRRADAGDIVMQKKVPIEEKDTAHTLFGKIAAAGAEAVAEFYPQLEKGEFRRIPQDHAQATVFGGRRPEDGRFSWGQDARAIYNLMRAVTHPYPGAFTGYAGKNFWVWWAAPLNGSQDPSGASPGTILDVKEGVGVTVATGRGALVLERVQLDGEQEKRAEVFAREKGLRAGAKLA